MRGRNRTAGQESLDNASSGLRLPLVTVDRVAPREQVPVRRACTTLF